MSFVYCGVALGGGGGRTASMPIFIIQIKSNQIKFIERKFMIKIRKSRWRDPCRLNTNIESCFFEIYPIYAFSWTRCHCLKKNKKKKRRVYTCSRPHHKSREVVVLTSWFMIIPIPVDFVSNIHFNSLSACVDYWHNNCTNDLNNRNN